MAEKNELFCMVYLEQVVVQHVSRTYFDQGGVKEPWSDGKVYDEVIFYKRL